MGIRISLLQAVQAVLFFSLLIAVSAWDLRYRIIPDRFQAGIALLSFLNFAPGQLLGALGAVPYLIVALFCKREGGIGGMPDVVQTFVSTKQMDEVLQIQRDIVRSYEDDMIKYAEKKDKSRIKECFQSIPKQLSKENKKFQYSIVKKGSTASKYAGSLQWIEDAGIIVRCYNLSITELPLDGNAEVNTFKVYMRDCGLFVSMLEDGTQYDILQGNLHAYKGAVFENLIADIFSKMGRKLYYFHKDSGLEVDFVIRYKGECTLVEVKASTGNTKSTRTILNHPEKYHVSHAIKLGDNNVGRAEQILTLPLYMAFLLKEI